MPAIKDAKGQMRMFANECHVVPAEENVPRLVVSVPHVKGSETSKEAADSFDPETILNRVIEAHQRNIERGLTDDQLYDYFPEICEGTMRDSTVRARRIWLEDQGVLYLSDEERKTKSNRNAGVYRMKG
jgi:hypothetical protein